MKGFFLTALVVAVLLVPTGSIGSADEREVRKPAGRIAIVNLDRLSKGHPEYEATEKEINDAKARFAAQGNELMRRHARILEAGMNAQKLGALDAAEWLSLASSEVLEKMRVLNTRPKDELEKFVNRRRQVFRDQVEKAVRDYAVKHGIDVVFSYSAVYAAPGSDITDDVILFLKKK